MGQLKARKEKSKSPPATFLTSEQLYHLAAPICKEERHPEKCHLGVYSLSDTTKEFEMKTNGRKL